MFSSVFILLGVVYQVTALLLVEKGPLRGVTLLDGAEVRLNVGILLAPVFVH